MGNGSSTPTTSGRRRTMPRIKPVDQNTADPATAELLNSVKKSMGTVSNLIATMAGAARSLEFGLHILAPGQTRAWRAVRGPMSHLSRI
jgi:hypothetical protein